MAHPRGAGLRIAVISPFVLRLRRGNERVTAALSVQLARLGATVEVWAWAGPLVPEPELATAGVGLVTMPPLRYYEAAWAQLFYARQLLRFRPDVVLTFFAGHGEALPLATVGRRCGATTVFLVSFPYAVAPHRFEEFRRFGLAGSLGAVVLIAEHMRPDVERFFGRGAVMIPLGVDTEHYRPGLGLANPFAEQARPRLVSVAALERRKGFATVLEALPAIERRHGPVLYSIVGDGPDRAWLAAEIARRGLRHRVTIEPPVSDVRPYLAHADLFLLPSVGEGLPNAFLEALAMGRPSIVSDAPPYNVIAHPGFALQVAPDDGAGMARAVGALLAEPARREAMGLAARSEAERLYAWPVVARRYLDLCAELAAHGGCGAS